MPVRSCFVALACSVLVPSAALAADGVVGPTSTASITIRVSVAPRAWSPAAGTVCVAAPASGYSLRLADGSAPVSTTTTSSGTCTGAAHAQTLAPSLQSSGETLLIVAE